MSGLPTQHLARLGIEKVIATYEITRNLGTTLAYIIAIIHIHLKVVPKRASIPLRSQAHFRALCLWSNPSSFIDTRHQQLAQVQDIAGTQHR